MSDALTRRGMVTTVVAAGAAALAGLVPICASAECVSDVRHLMTEKLDSFITIAESNGEKGCIILAFDAKGFEAAFFSLVRKHGGEAVLWSLDNLKGT